MPIANPPTIKRLGPSVSLKKNNNIMEQRIAVAPKITNEVFFDLKFIFVVLLDIGVIITFSFFNLYLFVSVHN
jgi:hypothetical protein